MGGTRIAVLMGGASGEHDVSMNSGQGVLAALLEKGWSAAPVVIGRDGRWLLPPEGYEISEEPSDVSRAPVRAAEGLAWLSGHVDLVFPALHGANGEDGTLQGMLQLAGIDFVGSDCCASALAMNKARTKDVYLAAGLATPDSVWFDSNDWRCDRQSLIKQIGALGIPCVIKTCRSGSSVGVSVVREGQSVAATVDELMPMSGDILVERFVKGREFTSGVINDPDAAGAACALPIVEIRPLSSAWFDYEAKYREGGSEELCPAPIPDSLATRMQAVGLAAHHRLGCRHMSRTDLIYDEDADLVFAIETNTIPGFTKMSLLPKAAAAAGFTYAELVDKLVRAALPVR